MRRKLADQTDLTITVCHLPPGTSKWNKIEHRLFSHISMKPGGADGGVLFLAAVLVGPDAFLLLGVHADHRVPGRGELAGPGVEVGELGVPVDVLPPSAVFTLACML